MRSPTESTPNQLNRLQQSLTATAIFVSATLFPGTQTYTTISSHTGTSFTPAAILAKLFNERRQYVEDIEEATFTRSAQMILRDVVNTEQADLARSILSSLENSVRRKGDNILPPIYVTESELTSSLYLEWVFPYGRVGFNIETDPSESGWYVLANQQGGQQLREWGYMVTFNPDWIATHILAQDSV